MPRLTEQGEPPLALDPEAEGAFAAVREPDFADVRPYGPLRIHTTPLPRQRQ